MTLKEAIKWTEHYGTQNLYIPSTWKDTFYGNDAMYSYEWGDVRIWIDTIDYTKSELGYDLPKDEYQRFHVVNSDKYRDENPEDYYNDLMLLSSNDWNEIVKFVDEKH